MPTNTSDSETGSSSPPSVDGNLHQSHSKDKNPTYSILPDWNTFDHKQCPPARLDNRQLQQSPWTNWEIVILKAYLGRYQSFNTSERKQLVGGTIAPVIKKWWKGKYDKAALSGDKRLKKEWDRKKTVSVSQHEIYIIAYIVFPTQQP